MVNKVNTYSWFPETYMKNHTRYHDAQAPVKPCSFKSSVDVRCLQSIAAPVNIRKENISLSLYKIGQIYAIFWLCCQLLNNLICKFYQDVCSNTKTSCTVHWMLNTGIRCSKEKHQNLYSDCYDSCFIGFVRPKYIENNLYISIFAHWS